MAQISCKELSIGYESHIVAEKLNFEINAGDYFAVVGENGAGKSTLIKTLLGLIKPLSGEIVFGEGLRKNEIGYLPQQTVVQRDFPASVFEVVISGCLSSMGSRPFYGEREKKSAKENIEKMGLVGLEKRSYRELSGGQQQRVLLARALCATRKLILLDEPTSGLDPKVTAELYDLIEKLNKGGTTVIMISHDIGAALEYANKILHIGAEIFFGDTSDYLISEIGRKFTGNGGDENE
ncbi:MAG: ABC transporter ATP-binding protein [Clostridia bacterium]|nr:ABC transporter ATP-binding protein [Clostridia bacterium]